MAVNLKPREQCMWDAAALGEIMLRLDPGDGRIRTTRTFKVWEGGGEYNVVRGLRRCFGLRTTVVTAIVDNEVGRLLEDLMLQGGVDLSHVKWENCPMRDEPEREVRFQYGMSLKPDFDSNAG
jgi:2-dehydro-3-deoxygluconokinase